MASAPKFAHRFNHTTQRWEPVEINTSSGPPTGTSPNASSTGSKGKTKNGQRSLQASKASSRRQKQQDRNRTHRRRKRGDVAETSLDDPLIPEISTHRRRRRLDKMAKHLQLQIDILSENRPYFLYFVLIVQTLVLIVSMTMYDLAPIHYQVEQRAKAVSQPDGSVVTYSRNVSPNIFIGPTPESLVLLGAKYGPCMRKDKSVERIYDNARPNYGDNLGCCTRQAGTLCYSSLPSECTDTFDNSSACYGSACCLDPENYPDCSYIPEESLGVGSEFDLCRCQVVARPCCHGLNAECSLETKEACDFLGGHFAESAASCDEVDCLESICGLLPFAEQYVPDQWYRMLLALFAPVGLLHYLVFGVAQWTIGVSLEKVSGWWRFAGLYLTSGFGGYVLASIFTPSQVEIGPSPAVYGMLAALMIELLQSWKHVRSPCWQMAKLLVIIFLALMIGLLPYVDNFAHIGGFACGLFSAVAFLPWTRGTLWQRTRKQICAFFSFLLLATLLGVGLAMFLTSQDPNCDWCQYVNCVDFVEGFCAQTAQRIVV